MDNATIGITQGDFRKLFDSGDEFLLIDVRRKPAYDADTAIIPGAAWRDPDDVDRWSADLDAANPIVAYCVHGHEVSQNVARALRSRGYDARFLEGGIDAWRAPAGPTAPKPL